MTRLAAITVALAVSACSTLPTAGTPHDRFFDRVSALCGKAFEGRIVSPPVEADAAFAGKPLVMHVRQCASDEIRIPFHVGEDRSRTWVITRIGQGLRLKHDHRHEDGSEDELTQYGGDSIGVGSETRQEFPADQFSRELFVRQGSSQSVPNVWAMEVEPARLFAYELRRQGRFFRVEFDLARPVPAPPPAWGSR